MGLCVFSSPIFLMMAVRIRVLNFIIFIKSEVWPICHCLGSGHDGMHCMPFFSFFINLWYGRITSWDILVLVMFTPNMVSCHWQAALLSCWGSYWLLTPSKYVFIGICFLCCMSERVLSALCLFMARTLRQLWRSSHTGTPLHEKNTRNVNGLSDTFNIITTSPLDLMSYQAAPG